jgi:hypothetical protein
VVVAARSGGVGPQWCACWCRPANHLAPTASRLRPRMLILAGRASCNGDQRSQFLDLFRIHERNPKSRNRLNLLANNSAWRAGWPLEDYYLHRCVQTLRHDCALRLRRRDERQCIPCPCRAGVSSYARIRRHWRHGQFARSEDPPVSETPSRRRELRYCSCRPTGQTTTPLKTHSSNSRR